MKKTMSKNGSKSQLLLVFFVFTAAIAPLLMAKPLLGVQTGYALLNNLLYFAVFLLCFFLQVLFHETGHLVFGLLTGFRFLSFRVGNLILCESGEGLTLKRYSLSGTLGQCLLLPPEKTDKNTFTLYYLGGALGNLVTALVCLAVYLVTPLQGIGAMFLLFLWAAGVVMACVNGIPQKSLPIPNDGENLRILLKDETARPFMRKQLLLAGALSQGQRLKDMPEEWFLLPSPADGKNPESAAFYAFTADRLLDGHRFLDALFFIENTPTEDSGILEIHRADMEMNRLYCLLVLGKTEEAAALLTPGFLEQLKKKNGSLTAALLQTATALLLYKDAAKAAKAEAAFIEAASKYPYAGEAESFRELLSYAKALYEKSL